jgi:phage tail sheath gpL-like
MAQFGLADLNKADPSNLADCMRSIAGPNMGIGDLLNAIIAKINQPADSTAAAATVTIAGTMHTGDVVTTTVGGNAVAYTLVAGDSTATLAAANIVAALNANAAMAALVTATNSAGVITLTAKRKGTGFNATALTAVVSGAGATTTATAQAATFGAATAGTGLDDILAIVNGSIIGN